MATESQINASRINGAKSKGPVTKTGREISSRNAIRHGLLARTIVLNGESRDRFNTLLAALRSELQPQTHIESALVEDMAVTHWRRRRIWGIEKAGFDHEVRKQESAPGSQDTLRQDAPTRAAIAFRSLSDTGRSLDLSGRYDARYAREYTRALNKLIQLQEKRDLSKRTASDL